ncbi:hypothetical protein [Fodinibius salsisoli]|uniref:Uncharacterized protein n=1 Tax=Fodinibius salsisoli TaxID=2820877 RepID=A0ABT3PIK1_9BACT|nr:hypothetical protein [Fodinibius salsisoli]MCW9705746.1 hypothetical protein [Fodinibius salsisoli]
MQNKPRKVTQKDLPLTIKNVSAVKKATIQEYVGYAILGIGGVVLLTGILTLLFGPSSLRIGLGGPTFTEFILLYPGPIASIGFFLVFAGSQVSSHAFDRVQQYVEDNYILHDEYNKPATDAIIAAAPSPKSDNSLTLHYLAVDNKPDTANANQPA